MTKKKLKKIKRDAIKKAKARKLAKFFRDRQAAIDEFNSIVTEDNFWARAWRRMQAEKRVDWQKEGF